jgi:hypothetical protein
LLCIVIPNIIIAEVDLTREERIALNRDWLARKNPDELLDGFIPVWVVVLYLIAGKQSFIILKE